MLRSLVIGAALCGAALPQGVMVAQGVVPIFAVLSSPPDTGTVLAAGRQLGLRVVEVAIPPPDSGSAMVRWTIDAVQFQEAMLLQLRALRKEAALRSGPTDTLAVRWADLDQSAPAPSTTDELAFLTRSWGQDTVRAPAAWARGVTGAGVKAGIIDTGYEISHPELAGRVVGCRSFTSSNLSGADGCAQPLAGCNWHGQHVAGTVAGSTAGVAPDALLVLAMNYEDISGQCRNWASARIAALNWLVSQGVKAVNVSTGGAGMIGSEWTAVRAALNRGVTVCGASGNDGAAQAYFPGGYPEALSIGALASNLTRASYSNHDSLRLDFALPGSSITSAIGASGYGSKSGTSMATPHCTGLVALACDVVPCNTASDVERVWAAMRGAAKDLGTAGHDGSHGHGLIRADRMVALLRGESLQPVSSAGTLTFAGPSPQTRCAAVDSPVEWTLSTAPGLSISREPTRVCITNTDPTPRTVSLTLTGVP